MLINKSHPDKLMPIVHNGVDGNLDSCGEVGGFQRKSLSYDNYGPTN